jgi:hypothetical protein
MKANVRFKDVKGFLTGHLVPAVDKVDKDASAMWGLVSSKRLGDENIELAVCGMDY